MLEEEEWTGGPRMKEKWIVLSLIIIKIYQNLEVERFLDFFNNLSKNAQIQFIRKMKKLIKYSNQRQKLFKLIQNEYLTRDIKQSAHELLEILDKREWEEQKYVTIKGEVFFIINDKLDLFSSSITDMSEILGLTKLENLKELILDTNQITKIEGLDNLTNLEVLNLASNQITKIEGLDTLTSLEVLNLASNQISKIEGLKSNTNIKVLNLSGNSISEITGLESLENLKELYISSNEISEIKGLENLNNLEKLSLSGNRIKEIRGIFHLERLKWLSLSHNNITNINDFELLNLRNLSISNNPITEFIKDMEVSPAGAANLFVKYCRYKKKIGNSAYSLEEYLRSQMPYVINRLNKLKRMKLKDKKNLF